MANTPYERLGSEDILSAHVNGIQYSIGNIETALELGTAQVTGARLSPVVDMEDSSLRYRIYEADKRGWLKTPAPVIYRGGTIVSPDEYTLQPAYGVIVFTVQQPASAVITASFTHVAGDSERLKEIEVATGKVNKIATDLDTLDGRVTGIDTRLTTIENSSGSGGGGGSGAIPTQLGASPLYLSGSYISHFRKDYRPLTDADPSEINKYTHIPAFNILCLGGTIDAFPLFLNRKTSFKQAGAMLGDSSYAVRARVGIYSDDNLRPKDLIFSTTDIIINPNEWGFEDIDLTLEAGLYWIARQDKSNSHWNGINRNSAETLEVFDGEKFARNIADPVQYITPYGGYRSTGNSWTDGGTMPSTYPSSGELFGRGAYGSPFLVVK